MYNRLGELKDQRQLWTNTWKIHLNLPNTNSPKVVVRATQSWSLVSYVTIKRKKKKLGGHLQLNAILFRGRSKIRSNSKLFSFVLLFAFCSLISSFEEPANAMSIHRVRNSGKHGIFLHPSSKNYYKKVAIPRKRAEKVRMAPNAQNFN